MYDAAGPRLDQYFNTEPGRDRTDSDFTYNPAGQLRSETRANPAYAWKDSVAVNRPYSANGQNPYVAAGPASFSCHLNGNLTRNGTTSRACEGREPSGVGERGEGGEAGARRGGR